MLGLAGVVALSGQDVIVPGGGGGRLTAAQGSTVVLGTSAAHVVHLGDVGVDATRQVAAEVVQKERRVCCDVQAVQRKHEKKPTKVAAVKMVKGPRMMIFIARVIGRFQVFDERYV